MITKKQKKTAEAQHKFLRLHEKITADILAGKEVSLKELEEAIKEIKEAKTLSDECTCRACGKEFKHKDEEQRVLTIIAAFKGYQYTEHRENGGKQIVFCHKCWTKMGLDEFVY